MSATGDSTAEFAARIAERLPSEQATWLGVAATSGPVALAEARRQAASGVLREAVLGVMERVADGDDPAALGGALLGAAEATRRIRATRQVDIVWTGPASTVRTARLTEAVVAELVREAGREILLVSYATRPDAAVADALDAAVAAGVEVVALFERSEDNPAYRGLAQPLPGLRYRRLAWPAAARTPGASMHAKLLVVDGVTALVGSANLTGRAMAQNLECGVLIRGGHEPGAIRAHVLDLVARGVLVRL